MAKKRICPICKNEHSGGFSEIGGEAYHWLIEKIKKEHPHWVKEDGACPKCIAYYRKIPPKKD